MCLVRFPAGDAAAQFLFLHFLGNLGVVSLHNVSCQISCKSCIIIALVAFVGLLPTVGRKPAVIRVSPPSQGTMDKGKKCETNSAGGCRERRREREHNATKY